jgi:PAS domain S-box-containing protein
MIMTIKIISMLMVLIGAVFLFLSFSPAVKISRKLIGQVRRQWLVILYLMGFFIFGYLSFDIILIRNLQFPLELVTGGVFLGGAVFVYIIINLSLNTVAALQKAEEAIRIAKDDWESTFDAVTDMVTVHDMDFNIVRANPAAMAILGLQKPEGISLKKCFSCYHGTESPPLGCVSCQSLKTEKPSAIEVFEPHLNKHLDIRAMPRFGNDHRLVGLIHVVRDITERKHAEEEKKSLAERLNRSEKMEALGLLAGGVAHDLNNVLGIVVGYAELLLYEASASSSIRPKLLEILNGGQKAAAIVQDMLTLARRGVSGKTVLNLNSVLSDCLKSPEVEQLLFFHSSVKIRSELEPDLPNISGSAVQLGKTIFNLLSNASEAMPKGGVLTIKTSYHFSSLKNYAASLNSGMLGFRNSMVAFAAARTASTGFWF